MKTQLEVKYTGKDKLYLHKEIGKGNLPDGRECRLIQTNSRIHMQVYGKSGKGWKDFTVSYMDLGKAISDIIPKIEKEKKDENKDR